MTEQEKNIKEELFDYYNCSECSSMIEINLIDEINNKIKFRCLNENKTKSLSINEYLEAIQRYYKPSINNDLCQTHNAKYISYCFECNYHLCEECLKTRNHIHHYKNNILEVQPTKSEINIYSKVIEYYNNEIEKLILLNKTKLKQLENKFKINTNKYCEMKDANINMNRKNEKIELIRIKKIYRNEIKIIKKNMKKK